MGLITMFDLDINITAPSNVFIIFGAKQAYSNPDGTNPWQLEIWFDNVMVNSTGGSGAASDSVSLFAAWNGVQPGVHNSKVLWTANNGITIRGSSFLILSTMR